MKFWDNGRFSNEEIDTILNKIKEFRNVNDGRVSFTSGSREWESVLISATGFEARADAIKKKVVSSTLSSPDLPLNFTRKDFQGIAWSFLKKYLNEDLRVFRVVFPVWNRPDFLTGVKKLEGVMLNFTPSESTQIFRKIEKERRSQQSDSAFQWHFTKETVNDLNACALCIAHVKANSPMDAYEQASAALYETLGLINLVVDSGKLSRMSWRSRGTLPVSEVLVGPHATVHHEDGSIAYRGFFYRNWAGGPGHKKLSDEKITVWERRYKTLERAIAGLHGKMNVKPLR